MYFPSCRHNAPLPQSCAPPDPATAAVAERWIIAYLVVLLCEFDRRVNTEESVKERTCAEAARAQRTASARRRVAIITWAQCRAKESRCRPLKCWQCIQVWEQKIGANRGTRGKDRPVPQEAYVKG